MKILRAHKTQYGHLYLAVDNIPKVTYEKVGLSYIGSDDEGYFSDYLKYEHGSGSFVAFAGRELCIHLKDGTIQKLKDHWWAYGNYDNEHEYVDIGLGTLEDLQDCYVFCSYCIRKDKLQILLDEYLKNNPFYDYWEIERWCKLQHSWYPLIFHGKQLPFLMNYRGDIIDTITKKSKYALLNICKIRNTKMGKRNFDLKLFRFEYKENGRLIKLEDKYENIVKETLPSKEFIKYKSLKVG